MPLHYTIKTHARSKWVVVQEMKGNGKTPCSKYWFSIKAAVSSLSTYEEILDISYFFALILTFSCCSFSTANSYWRWSYFSALFWFC